MLILLSDSLADPISNLKLIQRRLLFAGLIGLLFAVVAGYPPHRCMQSGFGDFERAADRIAAMPLTSR